MTVAQEGGGSWRGEKQKGGLQRKNYLPRASATEEKKVLSTERRQLPGGKRKGGGAVKVEQTPTSDF